MSLSPTQNFHHTDRPSLNTQKSKDRFLILARHGEKDCVPGLQDMDQPLTHFGASQCRLNGNLLLTRHVIPDFFLCSGVGRAVQSLEHVRHQFLGFYSLPEPVFCKHDLYMAHSPDQVSTIIARHVPEDAVCPMIMGHNPGMGALASILGEKSAPDLYRQIKNGYPSSTTCVFRFTGDGWWDLNAMTCELIHVFTGSYPLLDRSSLPQPL